VWAWGSGAGYKLGVGDQKDRYDPVLVPRLKEKIILQVSAAAWHSMAIVLYPPMMGGGVVRSSLLFRDAEPHLVTRSTLGEVDTTGSWHKEQNKSATLLSLWNIFTSLIPPSSLPLPL
jgi:hypothetical protein